MFALSFRRTCFLRTPRCQTLADRSSAPSFVFPNGREMGQVRSFTPGPGTYQSLGSIGQQRTSDRASAPAYSIASRTPAVLSQVGLEAL
jgi:hypothetical protein